MKISLRSPRWLIGKSFHSKGDRIMAPNEKAEELKSGSVAYEKSVSATKTKNLYNKMEIR